MCPFQTSWMTGRKGGFKLALCTVIFVQEDKLTSLRSVSLSRILCPHREDTGQELAVPYGSP